MNVTRMALGVAVMMLATVGLAAPRVSSTIHAARPSATLAAAPGSTDDSDEALSDLYGNDVDEAGATYQIDADGTLFEAHSPQTQIAKLGPPKS